MQTTGGVAGTVSARPSPRDAPIGALPDVCREVPLADIKRDFLAIMRDAHDTESCTVRLNLDAHCLPKPQDRACWPATW